MNSILLKYFIDLSIGHKDFSVIDKHIATELLLLEGFEKEFHVEYYADNLNLVKLWKRSIWDKHTELEKLIDEATKKSLDESIMKYEAALKYLTETGNMDVENARELLSFPQIKQKFGL